MSMQARIGGPRDVVIPVVQLGTTPRLIAGEWGWGCHLCDLGTSAASSGSEHEAWGAFMKHLLGDHGARRYEAIRRLQSELADARAQQRVLRSKLAVLAAVWNQGVGFVPGDARDALAQASRDLLRVLDSVKGPGETHNTEER